MTISRGTGWETTDGREGVRLSAGGIPGKNRGRRGFQGTSVEDPVGTVSLGRPPRVGRCLRDDPRPFPWSLGILDRVVAECVDVWALPLHHSEVTAGGPVGSAPDAPRLPTHPVPARLRRRQVQVRRWPTVGWDPGENVSVERWPLHPGPDPGPPQFPLENR